MAGRFAIVMAGGSGTRFWPASRAARPKQFLALGDAHESLLQATVRRASALVGMANVLVVTSARHGEDTRIQLPDLPRDNVLLEPIGRNTAPCIAWASAHVRRRDPEAVIATLPADPHIADEAAFSAAMLRALDAAGLGSIVTIGAQPTRAETGYGYLRIGELVAAGVHRVRAFVEKPTKENAQRYVKDGDHLWNCGMFFFRADVILREIALHLPEIHAFVQQADAADVQGAEQAFVDIAYTALPKVSIDYGVMEKARDVLVVPASFGWDDVGSWAASYELATKDSERNAAVGDLLALDAQGCYVNAAPNKLVVLLGVQDLVVVDTEDALLVMPRERAQDVGRIVEALKRTGRDRKL